MVIAKVEEKSTISVEKKEDNRSNEVEIFVDDPGKKKLPPQKDSVTIEVDVSKPVVLEKPKVKAVSRETTEFDPLLNKKDGEVYYVSEAVPVEQEKPIVFTPYKMDLSELVENMYNSVNEINDIGNRFELTEEDKNKRQKIRESLAADIMSDAVDSRTLKGSIKYGEETISVLELATKLNLGKEVTEAILDKAKFSVEEIKKAHNNIVKHRKIEKSLNYMEAAEEIRDSVGVGVSAGFLAGPVPMVIGASVGLAVGASYVATSGVGETPAKDTKKLLRQRLEESESSLKPTQKVNLIESDIEMQPLSKKGHSKSPTGGHSL